MRGARGRRTALGVWLAVAALLLAACSSGERRPRPQQAPTHRACAGVHLDDVRGPRPPYVAGGWRRSPTTTRCAGRCGCRPRTAGSCRRGWPLTGGLADRVGERLPLAPRLRGARLPAAARLAAHRPADRVDRPDRGAGLRRRPTFCRHGGALSQDRHGLWIVESNRLWLVDPDRVGRRRPGAAGVASRAAGAWLGAARRLARGGVLGVGAWRDAGPDHALVPLPRPAGRRVSPSWWPAVCPTRRRRRRCARRRRSGGCRARPAAGPECGRRPRCRPAGCW